MQQVDKNGTKTIMRLNEVVTRKRQRANSVSSSSSSSVSSSSSSSSTAKNSHEDMNSSISSSNSIRPDPTSQFNAGQAVHMRNESKIKSNLKEYNRFNKINNATTNIGSYNNNSNNKRAGGSLNMMNNGFHNAVISIGGRRITKINKEQENDFSRNYSAAAGVPVLATKAAAAAVVISADGSVNTNALLFHAEDKNYKFIIEFMAGALGGALSRTATAPIDRLRTVFQVQSIELNPGSNLTATSVWRYMILEGKWKSLWRGNMVNVLKTAPENAIKMATYEKLKHLINRQHPSKELSINDKFICGSFAGLIATGALYPLKTVKTIMNLGQTGEFKSIADCINQTFMKHGMRAFYRGLMANSVAIMPSAGIDLAAYESLKKYYSRYTNKKEPTVCEKIIIGNISSSFGSFFVYPLLFARTRLQSNRNPSETTMNILLHVLKKDGFLGMYRGFFLHILKIGPAASISYITFESFTKLFNLNSLS